MGFVWNSPGSTCFFAAVIWSIGSVALWCMTPIQPRLVVPASESIYEFSADSRFVWGRDFSAADRARMDSSTNANAESDAQTGEFRVRKVVDGSSVPIPSTVTEPPYAISPDGTAILVNVQKDEQNCAPVLFDITTGHRLELPTSEFQYSGCIRFTNDGRFVVFWRNTPDGGEAVWLERTSRRIVYTVPLGVGGIISEDDISASGRWFHINGQSVRVCEAASDQVLFDLSHLGLNHIPQFLPNDDFLLVGNGEYKSIIQLTNPSYALDLPRGEWLVMMTDPLTLVTANKDEETTIFSIWNLRTGEMTARRQYLNLSIHDPRHSTTPKPIRNRVLLGDSFKKPNLLQQTLTMFPYLSGLLTDSRDYMVTNVLTGAEELKISVSGTAMLSPDGHTLLVQRSSGDLEFWDIPARKSWTWFAAATLIWLISVLWFARRRSRRLRAGFQFEN